MSFPTRLGHRRARGLAAGLALSVLLAACTVPPPGANGPLHWARLGASYDQFMADRYDCIQRAHYVDTGGGVYQAQPVASLDVFKRCMEARGWYVNSAGYAPPANDEVRME